jgi:hypothetical protein
MSLPTYDEALKTARIGQAFSNGTEWEIWSYNWCENCRNDRDEDCPLIAVGLFGEKPAPDGQSERVTPAEWFEQDDGPSRYTCIHFRDEDDGGDPEPTPIPDPPGQLTLAPRDPFERPARMFTPTETPVEVRS